MSEKQEVVKVQPADAPAEWRDRAEITALANRLTAMLPSKLTPQEALLLAQYSAAMDANPFRGEVYAYQHRGKLVLVEGYKLLVRWARRQCNFYERYERITNGDDTIPEGAIAFRCRILRQDAIGDLATLTKAGVANAYEICSTEAVGVVTKADRTTREGKPMDPPTGWTWEEVARKRALKNALNRAYGSPSPREIAEESWKVEDTVTIPEDWDVTMDVAPAEREATALYNARQRMSPPLEQTFAESMADLGFGDEEPTETEKTAPVTVSAEEQELRALREALEMPQEPVTEEVTEEPTPELPETTLEAPGKSSPWQNRGDLIFKVRNEVGYFGNAPHIINTLKKLEGDGHVSWDMPDQVLFLKLSAYAKMRADQKIAEGG